MQYKQFFAEGRYDTICRDIDNIPTDGDNIFMMNIAPSVPEAATNTQDSLRTAATPVMR